MTEKKTSKSTASSKRRSTVKTANPKSVKRASDEPSKKNIPPKKTWWYKTKRDFHNLSQQRQRFLARRPHRSFRMTNRRDYVRGLNIPGYWSLTTGVMKTFWQHKKVFLALIVWFVVLTFILSSAMSQETYQQLQETMGEAKESGFSGFFTTIGLFSGVAMSYLTGASTTDSTQQLVGGLLGLFAWLTTIWLMRAISIGKKPRMRDGLYSSGGPVIALTILVMVLIIQAVPAAIAVILYGALDASGMLSQTPILMLAGGAMILIATMSLYWAVSTLFAMVVVTLQGTYPFEALRLSGDIVTGRRVRILLRFFWMLFIVALLWAIILIPIIILDSALKNALPGISWLPIVPVVGLILLYMSIVFFAGYSYTFYRKVVEGDSKPTKN